ncbi:hypothetical protein, partial [Ileibacterium valens]|uniref:hypothetical protein n=1 Tax=Ileibacterium valens TaxID=1862668 RepID=UPI001E58B258
LILLSGSKLALLKNGNKIMRLLLSAAANFLIDISATFQLTYTNTTMKSSNGSLISCFEARVLINISS